MNRRHLLQLSASLGLAATLPGPVLAEPHAATDDSGQLRPPADGRIPVAFLISEGAVVIDFAGPWEVFENAMIAGPTPHPFQLYTVAETTAPIRASGGMRIVPDYALGTAPAPKIIVIPAQSDPSPAVIDWVRTASLTTDITMSVCTGAFLLAQTGLLSGKSATTHHGAYAELAMGFPDIRVRRGARFVETGNLATAGGLSSGIDLALRVVERYYGRAAALRTADNLEYQGLGWMNADSNQAYATARVSTDQHPLCAVCGMDVEVATALRSSYRGHTYYFCTDGHKKLFDARPELILSVG